MSHQTKDKRNIADKVKKILLSFSFQERMNQELEKFISEKKRLLNMSCDQIDLIYFKYKAELEHKKMLLPLFLVSIFVAIIMDWWKYFFNFIETMLKYSANQISLGHNEAESVQVVVIVFTILIMAVSISVLVYIIMYVKRIYFLSKEVMLIEEVRKKKSEG